MSGLLPRGFAEASFLHTAGLLVGGFTFSEFVFRYAESAAHHPLESPRGVRAFVML